MKAVFVIIGAIFVLAVTYLLLVPDMASQRRDVPQSPPSPMVVIEDNEDDAYVSPVEVSTTGNDKITKVSVGDEDAQTKINVRSHVYTVIDTQEDLANLAHTLSYVILPRNLSGQSNKLTAVYQRYVRVLEQVQALRQVNKNAVVRKSSAFPRTDNHFVLFKKDEDESRVTIENYNYELSYKVLDFFQAKYPDVQFDQEGPYIITTARNVMNGEEDFSFLYMNLSSFNNSAINEAIESYKSRLVNKGNSDIERLEGWKYSLLSALTNFNADIHIVRSAVAGEL